MCTMDDMAIEIYLYDKKKFKKINLFRGWYNLEGILVGCIFVWYEDQTSIIELFQGNCNFTPSSHNIVLF